MRLSPCAKGCETPTSRSKPCLFPADPQQNETFGTWRISFRVQAGMTLALFALVLSRPLAGHSIVYSARDKTVLLIGGDTVGGLPIYRLKGGAWKAVPNSDFPARSLAAVAADEAGNVLVNGGAIGRQRPDGGIDFKVTSETWLWNGQKWSLVATTGPTPRDHHAMAYDRGRHRFVMFGGSDADPSRRSEFFGDTWEWDGHAWLQVATTGPGSRCHFSMSYDPVNKCTVLVGGYGPRGGDGKTWTWDGKAWRAVAQGVPADRISPRLAWDDVNKRILLFGGESGGARPSDTWAWTGTAWKRVAQTGPPGRTVHGLAWDRERKAMIAYGGSNGNDVLGDLWSFNAGKWQELP